MAMLKTHGFSMRTTSKNDISAWWIVVFVVFGPHLKAVLGPTKKVLGEISVVDPKCSEKLSI
jgi:hypothetical protein